MRVARERFAEPNADAVRGYRYQYEYFDVETLYEQEAPGGLWRAVV